MLRDLKSWTQAELAKHSGINATNLSLLENDRVEIGKKRVEQLAKAFDVHPAIIMFPEYEAKEIQKDKGIENDAERHRVSSRVSPVKGRPR